jgi:serine protease
MNGHDDEAPVFVIETHPGQNIERVRQKLADSEFRAREPMPMFPDAPESIRKDDDLDLRRFWLLQHPGPGFDAWERSPYDTAYDLMELAELRSVEPDIPTGIYQPVLPQLGSPCNEPDAKCPPDRGWALRNIRAPQAWQFLAKKQSPLGSDILIGQPDTGVAGHVDLDWCLDFSRAINLIELNQLPIDPLQSGLGLSPGHGTATSSVAVSRGTLTPYLPPQSYGTGPPGNITGSAYHATIVPIRAVKSVIRLTQRRVAQAVEHARAKGCHVISMSLGGLPLRALEAAVRRAVGDQLIVVAAAGNCVGMVVWPARYPSVICLGGSNIHDKPWKGSSNGARVDVSAPAEFVWRAIRQSPTDPSPYEAVFGGQGTSYATALTAGVAALWLTGRRAELIGKLMPGDTLQEAFRKCLKATARSVPGWNKQRFGTGIVDAGNLIESDCGVTPGGAIFPTGRVDYGVQAMNVKEDLEFDAKVANEASKLWATVENLSDERRSFFGHELLALMGDLAWRQALGEHADPMYAQLGLPRLSPSKRLANEIS